MSWDTRLAEPVALKGADRPLVTLRDAAVFLMQRFAAARSGMLTGAVEDLMAAAEDPSSEHIRQATFQLVRLLREERLVEKMPDGLRLSADADIGKRIARMLRPRGPKAGNDEETRS